MVELVIEAEAFFLHTSARVIFGTDSLSRGLRLPSKESKLF